MSCKSAQSVDKEGYTHIYIQTFKVMVKYDMAVKSNETQSNHIDKIGLLIQRVAQQTKAYGEALTPQYIPIC